MLMPTIHFNGNCNEAIMFYKDNLNAVIKEIAYAKDAPPDSGMDGYPPDFIMHSEIEIFGSLCGMTDGSDGNLSIDSFCFTLFFDNDDDVKRIFNILSDGGTIVEPLQPQFWTSMYGYVKDRFGINWSINTRCC